MKNDFRTLEQKIRQIMMSEKEKNVTQPAELDNINENTFEVKYAERKKGPIKVSKFKNLEDAKEFLSTVRAAGSNGIISKGGKPVKEEVELDEGTVNNIVLGANLRIEEAYRPIGGAGSWAAAAPFVAKYGVGGHDEGTVQISFRSAADKRKWMKKQSIAGKEIVKQTATFVELPASFKKYAKKEDHPEIYQVKESVEHIDELKKSTLSKYAQKAFTQHTNRYGVAAVGHVRGREEHPDDARVRRNRKKGVQRAISKMGDPKYGKKMKEETQIDELKKSTKKEACWTGYKQAGMKKKGDKVVPNCVPENYIDEKAVSQAQQKLMGMAYAYKKGELENASETVKRIASSMSMKELRDFAKTKHENLPNKKTNESVSEGILFREYEPGEYRNGEEKRFVDLIKKNGGKNISVEKPTRREPNLHIEFEGGNLSKMQKDLDRIDDGLTNLEEAVSPAQQAAIAISKKKLKKMNTEATDKDSISNKELKSVGKGKKDKIKINPKMENDKQIDNTSEEM